MSEALEKQYALRLPVDMYAEIEQWARDEFRSVNGQIVAILRDAVAERRAQQQAARKRQIDDGGKIETESKTLNHAAHEPVAAF